MTCPSCGRIAGAGLERCPSCNSSLAIPTDRPDVPTPIVRAPTNRGELAQRAAGIFARSLVPTRAPEGRSPDGPDQSWAGGEPRPGLISVPPPPPPIGGLAGEPAPAPPGVDGRYHEPVQPSPSKPSLAPPDARSSSVGPVARPGSGWTTQPPTAPGAVVTDTAGLARPHPAPAAHAAVDTTAAFPVPTPTALEHHAGPDVSGAGDEPADEPRPRTVRPGVDAAWPPPPGPWSGRRTSES